MTTTGQVFDQSEAAGYIGASRNLIRKALLSGALPARKLGRRWFIGRAALDAWLATGSPEAADASGNASHPERRP